MEYPDQYWHCRVTLKSDQGREEAAAFDMTFNQLNERILIPSSRRLQFTVGGLLVRELEEIIEIQVVHTKHPLQLIEKRYKNHLIAKGLAPYNYDLNNLPFEFDDPNDFTNELLLSQVQRHNPPQQLADIRRLCKRLPLALGAIRNRRKGKSPYQINDEYDVHDLLLYTLRAYYEGVIDEDPLSKVADSRSGKLDIGLPELGILIEIKYSRSAADQRRFVEEISEDLVFYPKWPHLKTLIFYVYNSRVLKNPEALAEFAGHHERGACEFEVEVITI